MSVLVFGPRRAGSQASEAFTGARIHSRKLCVNCLKITGYILLLFVGYSCLFTINK